MDLEETVQAFRALSLVWDLPPKLAECELPTSGGDHTGNEMNAIIDGSNPLDISVTITRNFESS